MNYFMSKLDIITSKYEHKIIKITFKWIIYVLFIHVELIFPIFLSQEIRERRNFFVYE